LSKQEPYIGCSLCKKEKRKKEKRRKKKKKKIVKNRDSWKKVVEQAGTLYRL